MPPPARKKPASRKATAAGKGTRKARSKGKAPRGSWLQRLRRRAIRLGITAVVGAALGVALVTWVLYDQAVRDVEALLERPVWPDAGRVLSAPVELWRGLSLTPEELAQDLQASGYARVRETEDPGDFRVTSKDVLIMVPAATGPGWKVPAAEVHVAFADGRVAAVSPSARVRLAPVELAGVRGSENESRHVVTLDQVPAHLVRAMVAMEDARFYEHEGLDPLGIARAVLVNAWKGDTVQGGSTLTQQVVKNLFLTEERSYERKAREAILAVALENRRSKDQILELYLNEIYLGQVGGLAVCGVDQAARMYFGKPADRLTLGEAATLVGIVPAPNRYNPVQHPEAAIDRRDLVLERMVQVGSLDFAVAEEEKRRPLEVHSVAAGRRAPWLVDAAIDRVEQELGEGAVAARGLVVHTTLQPALQRLAERAVAEGAAELDRDHPEARGAQIALVAVRASDGAIVAMVGGRDYATSSFDRALHASRQVGSTVKPLTYLAAFEADPTRSPATIVHDSPIERTVDGKTWAPTNYDGRFLGPITLRHALATSRNVPAVVVAEEVGMGRLRDDWQALGLSHATALPSAALGAFGATPVELAGAYTVFPGAGRWSPPAYVRAVTGPDGAVAWQQAPGTARRASARAAFLATSMLEEVIATGTGRKAASYGATGALGGKTGTTDDYRDAWFVGFDQTLVVAVWVGFDRDKAVGLTGGQAALPIWSRFMNQAGTAGRAFAVPDGVVRADICAESHAPATPACPQVVSEWFSAGRVPEATCPLHGGVVVKVEQAIGRTLSKVRDGPLGRLFGRREQPGE